MTAHLRVLVVDDEPAFLASIRRYLTSEGFDVVTATSGFKAIEAAKSGPFDLVTLDLVMPGMNGYETFLKLREILGEFALIIITAHKSLLRKYSDLKAIAMDTLFKGEYNIQKLVEDLIKIEEASMKVREEVLSETKQLSNAVEWGTISVSLLLGIFFLTSYLLWEMKRYIVFDPYVSLLAAVVCMTVFLTAGLSLYLTKKKAKTP